VTTRRARHSIRPRAWLGESYDFSFSGVKTHVLHTVAEQSDAPPDATFTPRLAAAFQDAVVDVLVSKTVRAAEEFGARWVLLAGGVAANGPLRETLIARSPVPVRYPPIRLCTDNAAMVGAAAFFRYRQGLQTDWSLGMRPNLKVV
jgi:N6-L-threonylcarbamoyladenine synthase